MGENELQNLINNDNFEYYQDNNFYYFRNKMLPWYANHPENYTRIDKQVIKKLSLEQLIKEINRGLEVEGITRITGYFSKTTKF